MSLHTTLRSLAMSLFVVASQVVVVLPAVADDDDELHRLRRYRVTIHNLTEGQPLSPPVVATHSKHGPDSLVMFRVGKSVSAEAEVLARDGFQIPMFLLFGGSPSVTEVVDVGVPLLPEISGWASDFSSSVNVEVKARSWDRLSMAAMLACTNDGLTGLDRAALPPGGSRLYLAKGYDAGVEDNTERSEHIVDACSELGPVVLPGDPDGNDNASVDTLPPEPLWLHPGVLLDGELQAVHTWKGAVAKVTVTRIAETGRVFSTPLSGFAEVPMVVSNGRGSAVFRLWQHPHGGDGGGGHGGASALRYRVILRDIGEVERIQVHLGLPDENGPIAATVFSAEEAAGPLDGDTHGIIRGWLRARDLDGGPFEGDFEGFLAAMRNGDLYVNVQTLIHPEGEIRGQIGVL